MSEVLDYSFFKSNTSERTPSFVFTSDFLFVICKFYGDLLKGDIEKVNNCGVIGLEVEELGLSAGDLDGESARVGVGDGADDGSVGVKWLDIGAGNVELDGDDIVDVAVVGDSELVAFGVSILVGDHDGQLVGGCTVVSA